MTAFYDITFNYDDEINFKQGSILKALTIPQITNITIRSLKRFRGVSNNKMAENSKLKSLE